MTDTASHNADVAARGPDADPPAADEGAPPLSDYSRAVTPDNCILFPAGDRLIIRRDEAAGASRGGIILPDTAKDTRTTRGTVMAVGPGRFSEHLYTERADGTMVPGGYAPMPFSVGDVVLYAKYAGNEVEVAGADFLVLSVADVLVKVVPHGDDTPAAG